MKNEISLVKGCYSPAEAADILLSLLNEKIKFHTIRAFNLRHEHVDSGMVSTAKINSLKQNKKIVEELVLNAHKKGFKLEINGSIEIKLVAHNDAISE